MTQTVQISTADFSSKVGADLMVGVGGTPMLARCPKDSVWNTLGKQEQEIQAGTLSEEVAETQLRVLCTAVFGQENGDRALAMLEDPANHEVSMESLGGLLGWCMEQWGPDVQAHFEKLTAGRANRAGRRSVAKKSAAGATSRKPAAAKAARKTPAKKAAAKRTPAAKG